MTEPLFTDRVDAGAKLALELKQHAGPGTLVVGLPRGGVVVAAEISRELDVPLDIIVARKIGAPGHPEYGIGAVAPSGVRYLDHDALRSLNISDDMLDEITEQAMREARERTRRYSPGRDMPELEGRKVIIADDGLATGSTARAAVAAAKEAGAAEIILAVPVAAEESVAMFRELVDEMVCLSTPSPFRAVGLWYRNFEQTTDLEVEELLRLYGLPHFK